jgi:hypothetical protein
MAASQLGVGEEPPGSNNVKYNTWYYGHPVSGPDYAWCAVFCLWCADKIGSPNLLNSHSAYVPTLYAEMKANGMAVPSGEPGDIVCFQFDTGLLDHVGIVEKRIGPGTYQTIEGNTGDEVQRHTRSGEMYFCRPKYDTQPEEDDVGIAIQVGEKGKAWDFTGYIDSGKGALAYLDIINKDNDPIKVTLDVVMSDGGRKTMENALTVQPHKNVGKPDFVTLEVGKFMGISGNFHLFVSANGDFVGKLTQVMK